MAMEHKPEQGMLENEPREYRIILRRGARTRQVQSLDDLLEEPDDTVAPEDVFWEGPVEDLKTANLWEMAELVPTIDADWYELERKTGDNEYEIIGTFSDEADYDDTIEKVTKPVETGSSVD